MNCPPWSSPSPASNRCSIHSDKPISESILIYSAFILILVFQRLQACQQFSNQGILSRQSLFIKIPNHHTRYVFPGKLLGLLLSLEFLFQNLQNPCSLRCFYWCLSSVLEVANCGSFAKFKVLSVLVLKMWWKENGWVRSQVHSTVCVSSSDHYFAADSQVTRGEIPTSFTRSRLPLIRVTRCVSSLTTVYLS